jgi:hypothetical protein
LKKVGKNLNLSLKEHEAKRYLTKPQVLAENDISSVTIDLPTAEDVQDVLDDLKVSITTEGGQTVQILP